MTDSVVFVVRIWPDALPGSGFRALVRRIDREQTQTFVDAAELLRFLTQDPWTVTSPAPPGPGNRSDPGAATGPNAAAIERYPKDNSGPWRYR